MDMASLKCPLDSSAWSMTRALNETEQFAKTAGATWEEMLCLRLLTEELLGMVYGVLEVRSGSFWVEREGKCFQLHVSAQPVSVGGEAKKRLMSVSSSGENTFYQGLSGKIRMVLDWLSLDVADIPLVPNGVEEGFMPDSKAMLWSLEQYRASTAREQRAMEWDELERSVITRLGDDIRVGVGKGEISLTVHKTFKS